MRYKNTIYFYYPSQNRYTEVKEDDEDEEEENDDDNDEDEDEDKVNGRRNAVINAVCNMKGCCATL